jgi:hypothetical protein
MKFLLVFIVVHDGYMSGPERDFDTRRTPGYWESWGSSNMSVTLSVESVHDTFEECRDAMQLILTSKDALGVVGCTPADSGFFGPQEQQ